MKQKSQTKSYIVKKRTNSEVAQAPQLIDSNINQPEWLDEKSQRDRRRKSKY